MDLEAEKTTSRDRPDADEPITFIFINALLLPSFPFHFLRLNTPTALLLIPFLFSSYYYTSIVLLSHTL